MLEKKYIIALVIVGIIILGTATYFIIKTITKNPGPPTPPTPSPTPSPTPTPSPPSPTPPTPPTPPSPTPPSPTPSSECSSDNCNNCNKNNCKSQDNCIYDDSSGKCQTKKPCVFNCTTNGKCNELTGRCDCNDRYSGDSCQFFYPTSLPENICFVPGKGGNGKIKTKHNSATGSMYSTFVITCPVFSYSEGIYKRDKDCGEGSESYECITYCNTLSSSSLKWSASTGNCGNYGQCSIPDSYNAAMKYSTIQDMDNANPIKTQQTSDLGVRFLFPSSDPDNAEPPADVQWSLNDFMIINDDNKKPIEYYQIISNSIVNQTCGMDPKFVSQDTQFYNNNDDTYEEMLGKGIQLNVVSIGISAKNLQNIKTESIKSDTIREAQLIPLITDDFMEPQSLPGDFANGTTWINLGNCSSTKMTIYIRLKLPNSASYVRLYLYSQSSQLTVNSASWLGYCTCFGNVTAGDPCYCGYENNQIIPANIRNNNNSMSPMLYWVVWPDEDIEKAKDFNSEESYTLGGKADKYKNPPYNLRMPTLGDFFKWNFYGVGYFPQMLPGGKTPLGYDTPDGGGAPSCNLPACPPDISNLYFMDKNGGGKDKSACHLLAAEPDKFNCILDKSSYSCDIPQGVWGFDVSNGGQCVNIGCGNVLTYKCDNGLSDTTDTTQMCDLTRQPQSYYKIESITPSEANNWGGKGILSVSANICKDPSTQLKNLYTVVNGDCVSNNRVNNNEPSNLFADPNCLYKCSDYGMKQQQTCSPGTFYCQDGTSCKAADKGGGTQAYKCYTDNDCNNECSGAPPTPPGPTPPGPPSSDICKTKCGSASYCKDNGTCQGCDNINCP